MKRERSMIGACLSAAIGQSEKAPAVRLKTEAGCASMERPKAVDPGSNPGVSTNPWREEMAALVNRCGGTVVSYTHQELVIGSSFTVRWVDDSRPELAFDQRETVLREVTRAEYEACRWPKRYDHRDGTRYYEVGFD